jgi:glucoamylase
MTNFNAPGRPGGAPHWSSSAKMGVGNSLESAARCTFTLGRGILNEIYYPRLDSPNTRDMGLVIAAEDGYFSEEQHDADHQICQPESGIPLYEVTSTDRRKAYKIHKRFVCDQDRDVILQWTKFSPLRLGRHALVNPSLYVLLNPHVGGRGADNKGWVGGYKGHPLLYASRGRVTLALGCSQPFLKRSAGFSGTSDGWQDIKRHGRMTWQYQCADEGNVVLTAQIELDKSNEFLLAVGFGENAAEAGQRVVYSLNDGFDDARRRYVAGWQTWHKDIGDSKLSAKPRESDKPQIETIYPISTMVLRLHESQNFPGATIASLSIPWGQAKGDKDLGGYHEVWGRDMCEAIGGLISAGASEEVCRGLAYLRATQEADGHWPQVMWVDGTGSRSGIQMDETALPILLLDLASRNKIISGSRLAGYRSMVRQAAGYLIRRGPSTPQDRWENAPGFSSFTLATEVAAMLIAADDAQSQQHGKLADYLRQTADLWNACIEPWTYVRGTALAKRCGVDGYYVRIAPPHMGGELVPDPHGYNRRLSQSGHPAAEIVSPDALALVRFGLRAPDDPRILNTLKVIDAVLKTQTPFGPGWHRYNNDNYGETDDGRPFTSREGGGHGRLWPLLTGERAHYELAAGHEQEARRLRKTMAAFAGEGGLLPEQVWDSTDLPECGLKLGHPTGSAMPLVWAHAEYVKLCRSLDDKEVFDMPPAVTERYAAGSPPSVRHAAWRFGHPFNEIRRGLNLRLEVHAEAIVKYTLDTWKTVREIKTRDTQLGLHVADIPCKSLNAGSAVEFTFHWTAANKWEGNNFNVKIKPQHPE